MSNVRSTQPTMEDLLKRVANEDQVKVGDKISGKIINITKSEVILDIENIGLGIVRGRELYNDEYISLLKPGETVEAIVLSLDNERGMLELSFRAVGRDRVWAELVSAMEERKTVEAKIRDVNRGGFLVKVMGIYGFLPASLLAPAHAIKQIGSVESQNLVNQMKKFVGHTFNVKVVSLNEEQDTAVVSEKAVSDEISAVKLKKYKIGDKIEGAVVGVVDFGLFVRFDDDLEGLVHISEVAWKKVANLNDHFKVGDKVTAKIIEIDEDNRINLSIKQTQENPWVKFAKENKAGDKFVGTVNKIVSYGAIVSNEDDVQGLCHITQMSEDGVDSPAKIHDILKIGEKKEFTILSLDHTDKLYLTLLPLSTAKKIQEQHRKQEEARKLEEELKAIDNK